MTAPIFFGAAMRDYVCLAQMGIQLLTSEPFQKHNVTIREFDGDHWIILSHAAEINEALLAWIEDVVVEKSKL